MSQLVFDEDTAQQIEALYQVRDAVRRRRLVREALGAAPGERVLDVGCGPGFYCAELREEVGPDGSVVGVDGSPPMLELAARRCAGLDNVALHEADALALPLDDASVDAAICVRVLEYVADATAALGEIRRVLRPGGRAVIWDVDWATLSIHSEDAARTERVLRAWDTHVTHPSLPRTLAPRLRAAGFGRVAATGHAFTAFEFDPETYGGAIVPNIAGFVAGREGIGEEEAEAWLAEQRALGKRGAFSFAVMQFCFTATNTPRAGAGSAGPGPSGPSTSGA
jgi:arsenite methyltransferase